MKILIQIGAGMGDLDPRNQYQDGFTDFVKKNYKPNFMIRY